MNFCSRDFLFHKEFDDSTLAKRHIVVGHFIRSDTGHIMQAIDVTRHSRITTAGSIYHRTLLRLLFPVRMQEIVARDFRYNRRTIYAVVKCTMIHCTQCKIPEDGIPHGQNTLHFNRYLCLWFINTNISLFPLLHERVTILLMLEAVRRSALSFLLCKFENMEFMHVLRVTAGHAVAQLVEA